MMRHLKKLPESLDIKRSISALPRNLSRLKKPPLFRSYHNFCSESDKLLVWKDSDFYRVQHSGAGFIDFLNRLRIRPAKISPYVTEPALSLMIRQAIHQQHPQQAEEEFWWIKQKALRILWFLLSSSPLKERAMVKGN
jgi:hypothetical protein